MALGFLRKLLMSTGYEELQPEDARLAIASVLVMAARADGKYDDHEAAIIDRVLARRFGLSADLARGLREQGEEAEGESIDIYQFTKAIRTAIPHEDRVAIIEELWGIVLADGVRDPNEDTLMRQIVDRLGLSPMDSALARQKTQGGGSAPGM
jgi:uncharacterized tellurite resistance protein B-like protein